MTVTRCRWARLSDDGAGNLIRRTVAPVALGTVEAPVVFPQRPGGLDWLLGPAAAGTAQSPDAFQASVFTPSDVPTAGAPLLIYIPGGGYISGGASVRWYDGAELARASGAVVAVLGYRLGAAACFGAGPQATPPLIDDVRSGIGWAIHHARHFGGNPDDVTLAGHSAGAWLAFFAAQDPELAARVRRLALYSLPFQPPPGPEGSRARRQILEGFLAGNDPSRADAELLSAATAAVNKAWAGRGLGVQPLAGGALREDVQAWAAAVARLRVEQVLLATTAHEARGFFPPTMAPSVTDAAAAAFRATHFARPDERPSAGTAWERMTADFTEHQFASVARELAGELRKAGIAVHVSRFDVPGQIDGAGSPHCLDVPFLFGNLPSWRDSPMLAGLEAGAFDPIAAAWRDPLVRALSGREVSTRPGEIRRVALEAGVPKIAAVPDSTGGSPVRIAEP